MESSVTVGHHVPYSKIRVLFLKEGTERLQELQVGKN